MLTKIVKMPAAVFLFCMASFYSIQLQAQEPADKLAQVMTDSLAYLQLNDQQKAEALTFNKTAATSLVQLKQKSKEDTSFKGRALAQQVMGVMKKRNDALVKILTPDQQKLYDQHKVEQIAELQTRMMTAQLALTDEQVPQVYKVNLKATGEMMQGMEKVKESNRKLQKARAGKELKSDSADKDKALKKILTTGQYDKYEKNKEAMQAAIKEKMEQKKG